MITRLQAREKRNSVENASQIVKHAGKRPAMEVADKPPAVKRSALGDLTNGLRKVQIGSSKDLKLDIDQRTSVALQRINNRDAVNDGLLRVPLLLSDRRSLERRTDHVAANSLDAENAHMRRSGPITIHCDDDVAHCNDEFLELEEVSLACASPALDCMGLDSSLPQSTSNYLAESDENDVVLRKRTSLEQQPDDSPTDVNDAVREIAAIVKTAVEEYDFDKENEFDPCYVPWYAQDIFDYYRKRELLFIIPDYMSKQSADGVTRQMRSILVDWMVEVQENFELNHETLYQAVKMTDLYLSKVTISKEVLQLVAATSLFVSSKFDECCPPLSEDFLYICDDAYDQQQLLQMEQSILKALDFDIGFPLSYRFLRRYAKAAKVSMPTLTLARYILELSLLHYDMVHVLDSQVAAASLLLALRMTLESFWTGVHVKYSGYTVDQLEPLMWRLNKIVKGSACTKSLTNIVNKYSHEVFHCVAKIPPLDDPPVRTP